MKCNYCSKEFIPSRKQIERKRGYCSKECLWERRLVYGLVKRIEGRYGRKIKKVILIDTKGKITTEINKKKKIRDESKK